LSEELSWVTISRYLAEQTARQLADKFEVAGIDVRLDPEGATEDNLYRLRVPLDQAIAAFEALKAEVTEEFRWPPPRQQKMGVAGALRRLIESARRPSSSLEEAEMSVEAALELVRRDPTSPRHRLQLARALLSTDDSELEEIATGKVLEWARCAIDEAIFLGAGPEAAFELAELCLEQERPNEAAAWIEEAADSGTDPSRAAYLLCELEFLKGNLKALKNAVSHYRRIVDTPDLNLLYAAGLLYSAGEKGMAVRLADTALRDGEFASEDEWVTAAALKIVMEGAAAESVADLASFLPGPEAADQAITDARAELDRLRSRWKRALNAVKKRQLESGTREERQRRRQADGRERTDPRRK